MLVANQRTLTVIVEIRVSAWIPAPTPFGLLENEMANVFQ
jgi:hypothetical protein